MGRTGQESVSTQDPVWFLLAPHIHESFRSSDGCRRLSGGGLKVDVRQNGDAEYSLCSIEKVVRNRSTLRIFVDPEVANMC